MKPALTEEKLDERVLRDFRKENNKQFKNSLNKLLPQKLIQPIIKKSSINPNKKVNEIIKNENVTLLFVTHATGVAKEFCKRGMVMESGVITFDGNIAEAIEKYNSSIK